MSAAQSPSDKIENYFKVNVTQMVNYLATTFACAKTYSQLKLLETIVFPSKSFTKQMILQWHKSMEAYYADVDAGRLDSLVESKSVWFLERIDFASKWPRIEASERSSIVQYFYGLNKLARNYATVESSELAKLVAQTAANKAVELPPMPEESKEQAEWIVKLTQGVLGALTSEQVTQVVAAVPSFVESMGGTEAVLEQARAANLIESASEEGGSPFDSIAQLLNPDTIRALVGGLYEHVDGVNIPGKEGAEVPLSSIVNETTRVLTSIVEGKASQDDVAGLGQRLTDTVDWSSIMSMLPPDISNMGMQLISQLGQSDAASGAGESGSGEPQAMDMGKVLDTVKTLTSTLLTPDSPMAEMIAGLMNSAGQPGAENPLAALLSPKK